MRTLQKEPETRNQIMGEIKSLPKITNNVFDVNTRAEYDMHSNIVIQLAEKQLVKEKRKFELDEHNLKLFQFLLFYFNESDKAETIFKDEDYKIHKQIMLVGDVGVGKNFTMEVFAEYLKITKNLNYFENISLTELINYYKIHNHLDEYTYNKLVNRPIRTNAKHICIHDLGLKTHNHFGVDTKSFIDDFLYARYELYTKFDIKAHITTNLCLSDLQKIFNSRLFDRFKAYNIIDLGGESRRK